MTLSFTLLSINYPLVGLGKAEWAHIMVKLVLIVFLTLRVSLSGLFG